MGNNFKYDEISVGDDFSFEAIISLDKQNQFTEISGDLNPLHIDKDYAVKNKFEDRVAYGLLTSSFYSKLIGVYIPGDRCLLNEITVKFKNPAYIGDKVEVSGKVIEKYDLFSQLVISAKIVRTSDSKVISKAKIKVGVL